MWCDPPLTSAAADDEVADIDVDAHDNATKAPAAPALPSAPAAAAAVAAVAVSAAVPLPAALALPAASASKAAPPSGGAMRDDDAGRSGSDDEVAEELTLTRAG